MNRNSGKDRKAKQIIRKTLFTYADILSHGHLHVLFKYMFLSPRGYPVYFCWIQITYDPHPRVRHTTLNIRHQKGVLLQLNVFCANWTLNWLFWAIKPLHILPLVWVQHSWWLVVKSGHQFLSSQKSCGLVQLTMRMLGWKTAKVKTPTVSSTTDIICKSVTCAAARPEGQGQAGLRKGLDCSC